MNWLHKIRARLDNHRYRHCARGAIRPFAGGALDLHNSLAREGYASQCGQDKWVAQYLLPDRQGGVFVDVGAHDGISFSNTWYLERERGWTGLAIEPMPGIFDRLRENRMCKCVNACVGEVQGVAKFREVNGYSEMLSGMLNAYDPRHLARIEREIAQHGGTWRDIDVPCAPLSALLDAHGIAEIDYLSIDTEGAEYAILRTLDFERIRVRVVGVENNYGDYRIPELLIRRGFRFHSIVGDEFYVGPDVAASFSREH